MTAMIRNLGKMSAIGLLKPLSSHATLVCNRLREEDLLRKARIHPFNVLVALSTYRSGSGDKGKLKWEVNQSIVQALDDAFYMSFKVCMPTIVKSLVVRNGLYAIMIFCGVHFALIHNQMLFYAVTVISCDHHIISICVCVCVCALREVTGSASTSSQMLLLLWTMAIVGHRKGYPVRWQP